MTHRAPTTAPSLTQAQIFDDKIGLRRHLLALRRDIAPALRREWDALIAQQVRTWCKQAGVRRLGIYTPIRNEPDLSALFLDLHQAGVVLCLPIVQQADAPLRFARWQPDTIMSRDQFGVPIPATPEWESLPEHILIPCVGFNSAGFRLGYGGGFYDRTLAIAPPGTQSVGIAYACLVSEFSPDRYDIALSRIITESGT